MPKYVRLPDNTLFPLKEGEDPSAAFAEAEKLYPQAFGFTEQKVESKDTKGFKAAAAAGFERLKGETALTAGKLGLMDVAEAEAYQKAQEEKATKRFTPTEEGWTEAPFQKIKETAGGSLPYMLAPAAAGAAALAAPVSAPVAMGLGLAGASLASAGQFTGTNIARQMDTGKTLEEASLASAVGAALPQAALDTAAMALLPGVGKLFGSVGSRLTTEQAKAIASQTLGRTIADYTAKTGMAMGREGLTESVQQVLERLQAGLAITDPEARKEYIDSFIGGAALAGVGAPVGRAFERSGAKRQAEMAVQEEAANAAAKAAAAEEAAKTTPEALIKLDDDFRAAKQQLAAMNQALETKPTKPPKPADPNSDEAAEAKLTYEHAKAEYDILKKQRDEFVAETFKPLVAEHNKRKDAIESMYTENMARLEQEAGQEQPTAPGAVRNTNLPVPVARLMDQYDQLRSKLDTVETNLAAAPDVATQKQIEAERADLIKRMEGLAPLIEERGGVTASEQDFMKQLESAEKKRRDLLQKGDFDAASKQADVVAELQAKLPHLEELRGLRTKMGQTRDLFTAAEAPIPSAEIADVAPPTPVKGMAATPDEAAPIPRAEKVQAAQVKLADANTALAAAVGAKNPEGINQALLQINEAENEVSRATEKQEQVVKPGLVLDLFDPGNIIRTAINNGDQKVLSDIARHTDTQKLRAALDEKATEKERLINVLESRLESPGIKRERADLFADLFDAKQRALFTNGTYQDTELQALYDKGGAAAVEYEVITRQVADLSKKVTAKQGNAKQSLYEQLVDLAAQHEAIKAQLESGIAAPTMGEKVAGVQAQLGKGEAPGPRQMDAAERYQLTRRLQAVENKYKLVEGKVMPVRDQIQKLWDSLYTTKAVEKPSAIAEKKQAASDAEARMPKQMSREAKRAQRINAGDVRREAEASEKMRDLAMELGRREPAYKKFLQDSKKRLDTLVKKYGSGDDAVSSYKAEVRSKMEELSASLGKKTPEYKATLKEQIAYVKEAFASAGKQEIKSKRTTQETRRQSAAPKTLRVAGSRMSQAEIEKEVREANDADGGVAYRLRESDAETTVDAAEAQKVIDGLKLPDNVKFVYAATPGKIPLRLLKMMQTDGIDPMDGMVQGAVFPDGTVLVVGDQHADVTDLERTIAHEIIGHYGVDTVIGLDRLNGFVRKTDIISLAEKIGGDKLVKEVLETVAANARLGRSEEVQKLQGMREIIAHTEEARVTEGFRDKAKRWINELVGMVREGLRAMGLKNLNALSTSDVFYMLKKSRKAFENKTIGPYRAADGETAFRLKRDPQPYKSVGKEPSVVDTFLGNVMGLAGRVQFVDQYAALESALKKGLSAGQISSLEATNANYLLRFGQQRSQFAGQFLTNGPVKLEVTKKPNGVESLYRSTKGVSMTDIAKKLNEAGIGNDTEQEAMFTLYVAGKRANQVGWNKLNFSDPAAAEDDYIDVLSRLNGDAKAKTAFEEAAKLYQQYNAGLLDFLVDTGALTSKKAAELKSVTYVPYYRINNNGEVQLMIDKETPVRISNIKDEPQLKELVGGNTAILPIFTSSVQNTFMITGMGLRNQAVKESAFALQKIGIASRVAQGKGPQGANIVRFKKKGEDYYALIDTDQYGIPAELIVRGMEGIKTTLPAVIKMLGIPADLLRSFVVRNPSYAFRQIIRDPLNAWLTTGTDATPVLSSMKELASMVAGRSEAERKLMATGAISSNVFSGDERDMSKFLKDVSAGKSGWDKAIAKLDAFAMQGDAATRAVIYKDSLAKGMSEQEALLRTLESMNFSRRGVSPSMQALSIMIPFFNAQIQGFDVLYRAFSGKMPFSEQLKIKEKLITRGLMLAAGTMAYAAMMSDDEAYKRAKPEERYSSWFVYVPGLSEPLRIPIPFELGYLFKALPEAVYNMAVNDEKASKALGGMAKLLEQTNPFSLPQAVKPLTEAILGKSFFSGDIESAREKSILATERYRESSTELSKLLGSVTGGVGVSAITIDHLIRGYTGPLGIALVSLANPLLASDARAEIQKPTTKLSKTPFIGGLFQPVEGRGTLDEAYDRMEEVRQVKGAYNNMLKEGRRAEAQAFVQRYADEIASASLSGAVQKSLGDLAALERKIRSHPTMTTEEKDERLAKIDAIKLQRARSFLAASDRTKPQ